MPYAINNPPDVIKDLPKHAQEIWIAAYNSAYEQYEKDEAKAAATAWAAVKHSYKQDKDGNWVKLEESTLETVDIDDVEILAVGKWKGSKEVNITKDAIPAFVSSFNELTTNPKLNYEPPVKLGHDENQKLLQADGYPAAGWISSLKAKGDILVASFKSVPKKLGGLIKAGAYKKVSAEFYQDYEIGGKKYPWVLRAVSLLGADVPAVKTIADIQALYSEQNEPEPVIIFTELIAVKPEVTPAAASETSKNIETEVGMEKQLRELLKLDEKADVLATVKALIEKSNGAVSLSEHQSTLAEVTTLKAKIAEGERDKRVANAINAGKITPAQKTWAEKYALSDPEGFDAFVVAAPRVIDLKEHGTEGNQPEEVQLTEAELKMAKELGVSKEALIKVKQSEK